MSEDEEVKLLIARLLGKWTFIPAMLVCGVAFWASDHEAFFVDYAATVLVRMTNFATLCAHNSLPRLWESVVFWAEGFRM
jgi:hypothetical protein